MSGPGIFRPPPARNEPVREYAPGSPERAELQARLEEMRSERLEIPCIIGGEEIKTGDTFEAVMPHDKDHVLAEVHKGGAAEVERAINASAEAWEDWHRLPWEDRAAVFLRAAELLAGPWRSTLVAATMLNQSKTAYQAEIDAACEVIDFWRFNVEFMLRIYEEQPVSSPGVWNRMEYRPLEGFVFAITPFNFTAIGANLSTSPALMGDVVLWKPASTAAYSAYWTMRLLEEAGVPPGVINLVYGSGAEISEPALVSDHLAGVHFTGSTAVFHSIWKTVGQNIDRYRNYPRIVGETGGKDFIVAHPSADVEAVATAILRGSFEYQGQKCSAASRVYAPANLWPELRERLVEEVGTIKMGDVSDFSNFMGAVIDAKSFARQREAIEHARANDSEVIAGGGTDDTNGYFVEPTVIQTKDPARPTDERGVLRADRHDLRLPRGRMGADARAGRRHRAVRPHRRDLLAGPRSYRRSPGGAALHGRKLLCERQADGRGRRPTALRRCARLGHERQGRLDVEPDPLGQPAHDQGDVRLAPGLPLSVHEERRRKRLRAARRELVADGPVL